MKRTPRGYVMIFVLLILLVLTMVVASLYAQGAELRSANQTLAMQQIAEMNADRGVQQAIQDLRSGNLNLTLIYNTCTPGNDHRNNCPAGYLEMPASPNPDGGIPILTNACTGSSACNPAEGAGLQYTYFVYRSANPSTPVNRYTIQATGYAGMSETALNLVTAVVEVEIEQGALSFQCVNSYECNGG